MLCSSCRPRPRASSRRAVPRPRRATSRRYPAARARDAPPTTRRARPVREIEMALALAVVRDAPGAALVTRRQQIAARLGLGEERRPSWSTGYSCVMSSKCCARASSSSSSGFGHKVGCHSRWPTPRFQPFASPYDERKMSASHGIASPGAFAAVGGARRCSGSGGWTAGSRAPTGAAGAPGRGRASATSPMRPRRSGAMRKYQVRPPAAAV